MAEVKQGHWAILICSKTKLKRKERIRWSQGRWIVYCHYIVRVGELGENMDECQSCIYYTSYHTILLVVVSFIHIGR